LVRYLTADGFEADVANQIAAFSIGEVGMFFVFLTLSAAAVLAIQSGWFGGKRAVWMGAFLGLVLVVDLTRTETPWIIYYNYQQRYASNPVLDVLRTNRFDHRVTVAPFRGGQLGQLQQFYQYEWLQHHFQFYDIQSLDVAQEPRQLADRAAYLRALLPTPARYWQLTNTRYVLGVAGTFTDELNKQLANGQPRFRNVLSFELHTTPEGYYPTTTNTTGPFALIEDTEVLPRAKLFAQWQVMTNDQAVLERLAAPDFNPAATVFVSESIAPPPDNAGTNAGTVEITKYVSRRVELKASSTQPAVLLLNDRYDPNWVVEVDGKPQELLRCNFLMRGVSLPAGQHTVVFRFATHPASFYVTFAAVLVGLALCAFVVIAERRR
jgi:hypothetical protein